MVPPPPPDPGKEAPEWSVRCHGVRTTRPAGLEILAPREARVTLYEGLYHQIKRLFGHFDNRVVALHRERIGPIRLDPSLAPGQYRALGADEIRLPGPAEPDVQELRRP